MRRILYDLGFIVLMASLFVVALFMAGPFIETTFFPVYSKFKLVSFKAFDGGTLVVFSYEKYRDCEPRGTLWFAGEIGEPSRHVDIQIQSEAPQPYKPPGKYLTSPYLIDITPEELPELYAELSSRCPLTPWTTKTIIYP